MKFIPIIAAAALVLFSGCDSEVPSIDDAKQALDKASEALQNLDKGKVEELAKLVSQIEKDPSKAQKLLKDHGITKEQLDKTLEKISGDPTMKKMFDAAKKLADSH